MGGKGIRKSGPRNTRITRKGGREPEKLPANGAKGRERGRGDSQEWPTEYTDNTEGGRAEGGSRGSRPRITRRGANGGKRTQKSGPRNTRNTRNTRKGRGRREGSGGGGGKVGVNLSAGVGAATCQPAGFELKGSHEFVAAISSFARASAGSGATGLRAPPGFAVRGLWLAGRWDGSGQQRRRSVGGVFAGFESGAVRDGSAAGCTGTAARVSGGFVESARGRKEQKPVSAPGDFGRAGRTLCSMNVRQGC